MDGWIEAGEIDPRARENVGTPPSYRSYRASTADLEGENVPGKTWASRSAGVGRWKEKLREGREGSGAGGGRQRVIDFCRGFARRYPLYPRLCAGPVCRGTPGWFAR